MPPSPAVAVLRRLLEGKPGAVNRPGQEAMTDAVASAIQERAHLLVEAGTGTGKSLAYLSAAYASNSRVVVSTATKALQDQLAHIELPFIAAHSDRSFSWAVVKGRASYVCMAKLTEQLISPDQIGLLDDEPTDVTVASIAAWADGDVTGDRDDVPMPVPAVVWDAVSVSGMECPGAGRCPQGQVCFAEAALDRARSADVIVTNHHFYALHLATGRRLLPDHDAVVFDEGHKLEDAVTAAFTIDVGGRRLTALAGRAGPHLGRGRGDVLDRLRRAADELDTVVSRLPATRVDPGDGDLGAAIARAIAAVGAVLEAIPEPVEGTQEAGAVARVTTQGGHVSSDFAMAMDLPDGWVAWAEPQRRTVRVAPIEVAPSLAASALVHLPVVITSATLTVGGSFAPTARRLGFADAPDAAPPPPDLDDVADPLELTYTGLRVEGAFDYASQGLLYVAAGLPPPSDPGWPDAASGEAARLVAAAGGRALILTTSHAMVERFSATLAASPFRVLAQGDESKRRLIAAFAADETAVLVATMGFWEGIDVPGPSLSLVVVDRLPFPRPNDPPMQAKRDAVSARGGSAFDEVDLPRAAMLLAQGAGRLIRSERDRGVVAVLDCRLATRRYGRRILLTLPGFARTSDGTRARRYLESLREARDLAR